MNSVLLNLSQEHQILAQTVHDFANRVVAPVAALHDRQQTFPYEVIKEMGKMGLFGLPFPEEVGGMGGDFLSLCLAIEELARVDQSVAITLEASVGLAAMQIFRAGTSQQKEKFLPALISGEALGAFGLTEPDGGSDAGHLRTTARLENDEWVINGAKTFITNSGTTITSIVIVACITGVNPDGSKELSTIIVPSGTPGLTVEPAYFITIK